MDKWIYDLDKVNVPIWVKYKDEILFFNSSFKITFDLDSDFIKNIGSNIELNWVLRLIESTSVGYYGPISLIGINYNKLLIPITDDFVIGILIPTLDIEKCKNASCMFNLLIDSIPEIIFCKDKNLKYTIINEECKKFYFERGICEVIGKNDLEFNLDKDFINACNKTDKLVINERKSFYIEEKVPIPKSDNFAIYQTIKTPIIDKQGNIHGLIGSVRDITKSKLIEERLRDLSYKDILTGLYNRTYFEEKISEIKKSDSFSIGVVIGDIDGLKKVNDTLGHIEGDNFIKSIANILKETCGDKGIVFRWGGDEFISLLIDVDEDDCKKYIEEVNLVCKNRYYKNLKVSISQGYSIFNEKSNIDKVLREADFMLYKDKKEPAK